MQPKVVTFGEVLMRFSPPAQSRFLQTNIFNVLYAGSEANVAASLSLFKVPAEHVTCLPDNNLGKAAEMELRQYGVNTDHIVFDEGRMALYFVEAGASLRSPKIIYDRFDSAFSRLDPGKFDWDSILDGAEWFHWSGITPAISASAAEACRQAVVTARKKGITVSGDINYRRNLWQYGKKPLEIMPEIIESCDMVVAGITDFENCLGISESTLEASCEKVVKKYPAIKKVATTNRGTIHASHNTLSGTLWTNKKTFQTREYDLSPIIDRVGAGDAFMAGLIYGFVNKMQDQDTLDFATAACALKHTVEGDVNAVGIQEVTELVKGENIGKLLR